LHIIWAKDSWINYSINYLEEQREPFDFTKYNSWKKIVDYNNRVISKVNSYFVNLHDKDLVKAVFRINNDGMKKICGKSGSVNLLIHLHSQEIKFYL
jgi:hypothetical protein